jgi:hypothetical protein
MNIGKPVSDDLRNSVIGLSISVRISGYDSVNLVISDLLEETIWFSVSDSVNDLVDIIRNNITL